ncbi:LOW QUALITY PROTEIN: hypothetical protein SORBI_3005G230400 [Sorghum bicolor]|uniref:Uncharacterized protein n=1 Tax=Sorghum bicolor TaxID=4558 RepID=A0A1Z5RK64_SORBI|nr:LOW QUALITY PROTEIN: hypothetical protein SORBI_3005G230400 [Sorghum bicolor]
MAAPRVVRGFTPAPRVDVDAASSSYLSRISLLMEEEDEEDDLADHPAFLHPFTQILSGAPLPDQAPVFPGGTPPEDKEYRTDMFTAAFFKAVEEATATLLARDTSSGGGKDRRDRHTVGGDDELEADAGRTSKMAMSESEEAGAREVFDEMMLRGFDVCSKEMEGLAISVENVPAKDDDKKKARKRSRAWGKRRPAKVIELHTLLIHRAKAVIDDRQSVDELLSQMKEHASPTGDATQRLVYWFVQGLEARLAGTESQVYRSLTANRTSLVEFLKAYQFFMKAAFMFANKTILDAAIGRSKLHIVDYGLRSGFQWTELLRLLGTRDGGPPQVRITSIDLPQPGFHPANHMAEMGHRLTSCAHELPLSFCYVVAPWHTVCIDDLNVEPDEVLVVNDLFNFRTLMDESVISDNPSPRDVVLSNIRKMEPDVFIQAVHVREWTVWNVVRHKLWQVRNQRADLRQLPLNGETVKMVRDMVKNQ